MYMIHFEEVYFGGPKLNYILQDWAHQSLVCGLFNVLWTCHKAISKEAKDPISLYANTANICVPFQISGNDSTSTSKIYVHGRFSSIIKIS